MRRCAWAEKGGEAMLRYHDEEYGRQKSGDAELFEKLSLECFQAGLSWRTVLLKRDALREAFRGFHPDDVAAMTDEDVERLMQDARLIRNRRKLRAVIRNANLARALIREKGSLREYFYAFDSGAKLCEDLKQRGFCFMGETVCTAFLQSVGAVEGHERGCFLYGASRNGEG